MAPAWIAIGAERVPTCQPNSPAAEETVTDPSRTPGGVPKVQDARVGVARVGRAAEVAQLGDGARGVRREPHAELVVGRIGCLGRRRRLGRRRTRSSSVPFSVRSVTVTVIAWVTAGAMPSLTLTVRS